MPTKILLDSRKPRINKSHPDYIKMVNEVNISLSKPIVNHGWGMFANCALMYCMDEGDMYGQFVKNNILELVRDSDPAVNPGWWDYDSHYLYRSLGVHCIIACDWCQELFTADEWKEVGDYFSAVAWRPWKGINWWSSNDTGNNYNVGYRLTSDVGSVTFLHSDLVNEAEIEEAKYPVYFSGPGKGGIIEGAVMNYSGASIANLVFGASVLKEAGVYDLFSKTEWFKESAGARIDLTTPWGSNALWGDAPQTVLGDFRTGDFLWALTLMDALPDGDEKFWLSTWLAKFSSKLSVYNPESLWMRILFTNDNVPQLNYFNRSLVSYIPQPGLFIRRSSWSDDATYSILGSGVYEQGHQQAGEGALEIGKDGWISASANLYSQSGELGIQGGTIYCNAPLVDGKSQFYRIQSNTPVNGLVRIGDGWSEHQYRDSYNRYEPVCYDASRRVQWLSDTLCVITDRLKPSKSGAEITWQWHGKNVTNPDPGIWIVSSPDTSKWSLRIRPLASKIGSFIPSIEDVTEDSGHGPTKISEVLRIRTKDTQIAWVIELIKDPDDTPISVSIDDQNNVHVWGNIIPPPGPTIPNPLSEIKIDSGDGGTIDKEPVLRENSKTKATKTDAPDGFMAALITGLPDTVTVKSATVDGELEDGKASGWEWRTNVATGDIGHLELSGNKITWQLEYPGYQNPSKSYKVHVVGSDDQFDDIPVDLVLVIEPDYKTLWQEDENKTKDLQIKLDSLQVKFDIDEQAIPNLTSTIKDLNAKIETTKADISKALQDIS